MRTALRRTLPSLSLGLTSLVFAGFGIVLMADPGLLETVGVRAVGPSGTVELRAFYGGLELGMAAFFYLASRRPDWYRPGLALQSLALGGLAACRLAGLAITGGWSVLILGLLSAEAAGAALGLYAWRAVRSASRDPRS